MRKSFCAGRILNIFDRLEGIYTNQIVPDDLAYSDYLLSKGYEGKKSMGKTGQTVLLMNMVKKVSGWQMRNSNLPSAVSRRNIQKLHILLIVHLNFLSAVGKEDQWCFTLKLY
ncbi:MAG: hypothetical protein CM1200mP30_27730 [Pseudomonadota bacterium]|nr:MAG: hypothetical protein CM1200mP30_27730 [Pseudomonadota bacterium]